MADLSRTTTTTTTSVKTAEDVRVSAPPPHDGNLLNDPALLKPHAPAGKFVTKNYHVGTTSESPFFNVACIVTFPEKTDTLVPRTDGSYDRRTREGDVVPLTDDQVAAIKERLKRKVVRITSRAKYDVDGRLTHRAQGVILNTDNPRYRPSAADEPLAKYLYMYEVQERRPSIL